jgi:hypothetical protein
MAFIIQGFGTTFVGQRDFEADGSYITTEWVVLLFIPVVPLRSLRVKEAASGGNPFVSTQSYRVYRKLPLHLKQVLCVYGFLALFIGLGMLAAIVSPHLPRYVGNTVSTVLILGVPLLVVWRLRSRAKKRILVAPQI